MEETTRLVSVSIVSHNQGELVKTLLEDLNRCAANLREVLLTQNIPETFPFGPRSFGFPLVIRENKSRQGFGANHNEAFRVSRGDVFCVLNPDIRLPDNPFPALLECLETQKSGVVTPLILSPSGAVEASARGWPTPRVILAKLLGRYPGPKDRPGDPPRPYDWVVGAFMLFTRDAFRKVRGFDERYFLYYEDVDICARLRLAGYNVVLCPSAQVVHAAQRKSHRHPRYLYWHLISMARFFLSGPYWAFRRLRRSERRALRSRVHN